MQRRLDVGDVFYTLAEDLKTPLVRIAYKAELATGSHKNIQEIQQTVAGTLQLIDAYLLAVRGQQQQALVFEPVSPSAVIADTAYDLIDVAKKFSCQVLVDVPHSGAYALTHRKSLQTALTAIGTVFIEAQNALQTKNRAITLSSYKTKQGFAVGIFCADDSVHLNAQLLSQARSHVGRAARPYVGFASGASSQLFIAEQLAQGLQSGLRTARRGKLTGLVVDLLATPQLTLI